MWMDLRLSAVLTTLPPLYGPEVPRLLLETGAGAFGARWPGGIPPFVRQDRAYHNDAVLRKPDFNESLTATAWSGGRRAGGPIPMKGPLEVGAAKRNTACAWSASLEADNSPSSGEFSICSALWGKDSPNPEGP